MMVCTFNLTDVIETVKRISLILFVLILLYQTSIQFVLKEFVQEETISLLMNVMMEMLLQMMDARVVLLTVAINVMKEIL